MVGWSGRRSTTPTWQISAPWMRSSGIQPAALETVLRSRGRDRPKLDVYDDTLFFVVVTLAHSGTTERLRTGEIVAFVGDAFILILRHEEGDIVTRAREELARSGHPATAMDTLHALIDTLLGDLNEVSSEVEDAILSAADHLFSNAGSDEADALYRITLQSLAMGHATQPLIEPLGHLDTRAPAAGESVLAGRFQDLFDQALVLDREVSDHRELVEHLRDSNDSRISLQQNEDMRKISAWAAILAVPTAITSFYGMNVPYPGFGVAGGVFTAVALQVVLAVSLFVVFRRRKWL